jgi:hypothetical protein
MKLELEISDTVAALLATLSDTGDVQEVVEQLIDHAQQGVYRPGAWEREWLCQAFSGDFIRKLEWGDPYNNDPRCAHIFQRPITGTWPQSQPVRES